MEEEHSGINNSNEIVQMTSSNSHRLQIRRGILRQTTTLRSSPYNSTLSSLRRRRRRQNSLIASQTINNLITNIENTNTNNINISSNDQDENEIIQENFLVTSDDENNHDDFEVLVDFSNTSSIINENNNSNESYHSLSTIDFDLDEDDDDDDHHHYYYTSTSIPVFDYSSSTEPLIHHNNPIEMTQYSYDDEYSSSINNNNNTNDNEDLSIEIILESSQNNSLSSIPRRRHSIIPSNNHGLHLSDILNIPQKLYSLFQQQLNNKYQFNTQCYICLEDFQLIDSIKILNCQHIFHTACINEWLRSHSNCAYCRTSIIIDISRTTTGRRQRTRTRRTMTRSSTNNSIEASMFQSQQL